MSKHHGHKWRGERVEERFDQYAWRVHRLLYSCDGCSARLHQTHNYVLYGNLCWTCWRLNQLHCELLVVSQ
jgi:hypothetical protein